MEITKGNTKPHFGSQEIKQDINRQKEWNTEGCLNANQ